MDNLVLELNCAPKYSKMFGVNKVKDRILTSGSEIKYQPQRIQGSLYQMVYRAMERYIEEDGDWKVFNNLLTGKSMTAIETLTYGKRLGAFFLQNGCKKGDVIHVLLGNHNMTFPICFGGWILGGCMSLGDVNLEPRSVAEQLNTCQTRFVICMPDTQKLVTEALKLASRPQDIKTFCLGKNEEFEDLNDLLRNIDPTECPDPMDMDVEEDVPVIFWSSGTTGHPKAICHSHNSAINFGGPAINFLVPKTNVVTTTCFFHVGGFFTGINACLKYQTYYHMFGPSFRLDHLLRAMSKLKPKTLAIGSHHYVQLSEYDGFHDANPDDFDSIEFLAPAGAAVPQSCEAIYKEKCRNLKGVLNAYGQTESGIISAGVSSQALGSILPNIRVKVENVSTGERCAPHEEGELCYKTPAMMKGYLNRPKDNADFLDFEGFGHSGDIVYYTPDGDIYFVDRLKELIKYKNNHIAPTELEDILQRHPAVQESLVFGKHNDEVQELVSAVVVLKPKHQATEAELIEFVNREVTDYKRIRGDIIFRDEIPRNSVGKLMRREMRDWARHQMRNQEQDFHRPIFHERMAVH